MLLLHQKKTSRLSLFQRVGITKPRSQMTGITLRLTRFWCKQMWTRTHGPSTPLHFAGDDLGWALSTLCQCIPTLRHSEQDRLHAEH